MIAKLSIICTKQENGSYFAVCPEIKGCFTQGDTYEDAISNIEELIKITIDEEMSREDIEEILSAKAKIYSELEVTV